MAAWPRDVASAARSAPVDRAASTPTFATFLRGRLARAACHEPGTPAQCNAIPLGVFLIPSTTHPTAPPALGMPHAAQVRNGPHLAISATHAMWPCGHSPTRPSMLATACAAAHPTCSDPQGCDRASPPVTRCALPSASKHPTGARHCCDPLSTHSCTHRVWLQAPVVPALSAHIDRAAALTPARG